VTVKPLGMDIIGLDESLFDYSFVSDLSWVQFLY